jgi:hypothetical protein
MASFLAVQFSPTVSTNQIEDFRRDLHASDHFRMCWTDERNNCTELPSNIFVCDINDLKIARTTLETELRQAGLYSSLDGLICAPLDAKTQFWSNRLCRDGRCDFQRAAEGGQRNALEENSSRGEADALNA